MRPGLPCLLAACLLAPATLPLAKRRLGPARQPPHRPHGRRRVAFAKVLRYAFRIAETGFDPAQISDLYSRTIAANLFEAPYQYEFLARPARLRPATAVALPEVSDDYRTWVVRLKPGIYFIDDPVFKGRRRELTAADYVYSIKRHFDPRWKSPHLSTLEEDRIVGIDALRKEALAGKAFDYDRPVEGIRAIDRYTLRFAPRAAETALRLSPERSFAWWARRARGGRSVRRRIMGHRWAPGLPVCRGASSRMVFEKNPGYREEFYDEEAPGEDPLAQTAATRLKGRRLPMIDRIEVSIIEENQPRWLSFLGDELDLLEQVPEDFTDIALPNGRLAPNLARRDIYSVRYPRADASMSYFAMENPLVGGYSADKVAPPRHRARRQLEEEIRIVRRGQAIRAVAIGPGTTGYDAAFRSEMSEFSRARAQALLDLHGYVDHDGDRWRDLPDGQPLVLEYATQPDEFSRQLITQWKKNMDAIGLRIVFRHAKWPENLKASRAGRLMMWGVGWSASVPDGGEFLVLGYGPSKGQSNHARFDLAEYNRLYELQSGCPRPRAPRGPAPSQRSGRLHAVQGLMRTASSPTGAALGVVYHRNIFLRESGVRRRRHGGKGAAGR